MRLGLRNFLHTPSEERLQQAQFFVKHMRPAINLLQSGGMKSSESPCREKKKGF